MLESISEETDTKTKRALEEIKKEDKYQKISTDDAETEINTEITTTLIHPETVPDAEKSLLNNTGDKMEMADEVPEKTVQSCHHKCICGVLADLSGFN